MLVIEMRFDGGRFHATPFGRNVNEGAVEWPPSPYRLARALVDVARRRYPDWDDARLERVLEPLSSPPAFWLPEATTSHVRTYMSCNKKDIFVRRKILDAFVAVDRADPVYMAFDVETDPAVLDDLDSLLRDLPYFGRAESWVSCRLGCGVPKRRPSAVPCEGGDSASSDGSVSGVRGDDAPLEGDPCELACLVPKEEFASRQIFDCSVKGGKKSKAKKTKPMSWLDAIMIDSGELIKQGWSVPPALKKVAYMVEPLGSKGGRMNIVSGRPRYSYARYAVHSNVLPRVEETIDFAGKIRKSLMGIHKRLMNDDPSKVSMRFSGKERNGLPTRNHVHAFVMPVDEDGDGYIDHVEIFASHPRLHGDQVFDESELAAIDRLRRVWPGKGRKEDIRLVLVGLSDKTGDQAGRVWTSITPFVTARHHRKGRGCFEDWLRSEVERECERHGLPSPVEITPVKIPPGYRRKIHWWAFRRARNGQRPMPARGFRIVFPEEVTGPVMLGSLCHYGLGRFVPEDE